MKKEYLTSSRVVKLASLMADRIKEQLPSVAHNQLCAFPIPRGGVPALYALMTHLPVTIAEDPLEADFFVDDIIDSGVTAERYRRKYKKPVFALVNKIAVPSLSWIVFPWENGKEDTDTSVTDNITRLLQYVGEDPSREGLKETPARVVKAWNYWCSGYNKDAAELLKVFNDGAEGCDEMIVVKNIPLYSKCEHHLADIFGTATVAYIPNGKIVGLSKISRLVDIFARRLQVQERLTNQIADSLQENLNPLGVGVIIKARHMCMESRGICQQGHHTVTSALRGVIKNRSHARAEFIELAK